MPSRASGKIAARYHAQIPKLTLIASAISWATFSSHAAIAEAQNQVLFDLSIEP